MLHRSLRNRSGSFRRALVNHYCNAWSLLPWSVTPSEKLHVYEIPTYDERRVVPIGEDPYAWKGVEDPPTQAFLRPHAKNDPLAQGFGSAGKQKKSRSR